MKPIKSEKQTELLGTIAPDFVLPSTKGPVRLQEAIGPQGLLISFIHATWCAACVDQLRRLQRRYYDYANAGVEVVAIVSDDPASAEAFQIAARPPFPFPLLADADLSVGGRYGLVDAEKNLLRPAIVLLDQTAHIRYVDVPDDPHAPLRHDPLLTIVRKLED